MTTIKYARCDWCDENAGATRVDDTGQRHWACGKHAREMDTSIIVANRLRLDQLKGKRS